MIFEVEIVHANAQHLEVQGRGRSMAASLPKPEFMCAIKR